MGEESGNTGRRANERLIALLEGLGWDSRGNPDIGISCEKPAHDAKTHGVDGYLVYQDPYYNSRRGVTIESKSKQWSSWSGDEMNAAANQARNTLECSILSDDFKEKLDYSKNDVVNASILGAWTNSEGFEQSKFNSFVESCSLKQSASGPYYVLILGNSDLNRLASLHSVHEEIASRYTESDENIKDIEFGFYYPPLQELKSEPQIEEPISFEYLFSDYVYAYLKYTEIDFDNESFDRNDIGIIYNFDSGSKEQLEFLYKSAREDGLLSADKIEVYTYGTRAESEDTKYESNVNDLKDNVLPENTEFDFKELPKVDYKSHANNLRGED